MGDIFLLRETHLENFMSRPNVIPTFRQHRCTNRGRNFVWSKR
ncbi:XRE family transcriptional regulator [Faecalibacterium prausnitzii]|nr:XRE family transcriptional regulator [Faecalibacterium prausnitzii]PDX79113.1 XRE family transcriptional regulator [Faecalibacterium prausnitzii]